MKNASIGDDICGKVVGTIGGAKGPIGRADSDKGSFERRRYVSRKNDTDF